MDKILRYNVSEYINSLVGGEHMQLNSVLSKYKRCKKYELSSEVSDYIHYIDEKPFYVEPMITDVKTNLKVSTLNSKIILFSAPGATGKSSLAKFIANKFNAAYWNLVRLTVGTNSFVGSILKAVGSSSYSDFIQDLNQANVLLMIDAFDEAEIISGRQMIGDFIKDIDSNISGAKEPCVFLFARTETAQYIASLCAESNISLVHYEIGFFNENSSLNFIKEKFEIEKGNSATKADIDLINLYYGTVKKTISEDEIQSFLGYAPVLEAISKHIISSKNPSKMISEFSGKRNYTDIIIKIMNDLLERERKDKIIPAFKEKCKELFPELISDNMDKLYSKNEQLFRIINYILFNDCNYKSYPLDKDILPPQLIDAYQELLNSIVPQHPFIRCTFTNNSIDKTTDFAGPAFRDYSLASALLDESISDVANLYFENDSNTSYIPSQVFFDCYIYFSNNIIHSSHISYIYDSYRAKATALELPFLQFNVINSDEDKLEYALSLEMNTNTKKENTNNGTLEFDVHMDDNKLNFDQINHAVIDAPDIELNVGRNGINSKIINSKIFCNKVNWRSHNLMIESDFKDGCILVAYNGFSGSPVIKTNTTPKEEQLKVYSPNIDEYYKLLGYKYDLEDTNSFDKMKFLHLLKHILFEFRTHRKDMLGKSAERIDNVTIGSSKEKRKIFDYLNDRGIVFKSEHLYKINEKKMQAVGIDFVSLLRMDVSHMSKVFDDYISWEKDNTTK